MRRSGAFLLAALLALAGWASPAPAQNPQLENVGFHLLGPGGGQGFEGYLCPNEPPPFLHWDLRQFPGCAIPFEINGAIAAPGNPTAAQVVTAVNLAADTWSQVTPTPVSLLNNNAANPGPCGPMPAQDSRNCVAWHPSWPFAANIYAVTALWRNASSGVIIETDVMLNQHPDGTKHWQASPPNCASSDIGIQGVMLHEFGHLLGLGHPDWVSNPAVCKNDDPGNTTVMYSITTNPCETSLAQADKDGVNYLYTPDLADLPDPPYTTLFRS